MFLKALNIPGSGLNAEQYRLSLISQNITNVETTRTESGGAYRRKVPIYQEIAGSANNETFSGYLAKAANSRLKASSYLKSSDEKVYAKGSVYVKPGLGGYELNSAERQTSGNFVRNKYNSGINAMGTEETNGGVRIVKVIEDPTPSKMVYDPNHPDANEEGYVEMPNVEMVQEMVNMMGASRSYEANVQVVNAMKAMASRALEIGR